MKKMKTTITIAIALAACVSTSLLAQTKEDVITLSLTSTHQASVSTSPSQPNKGNWSDGPMFYKTGAVKVTDQSVLKYIAFVAHGNASWFSSQAKLVLVQGELSGFFNITPELGKDSWPVSLYSSGAGLNGDFTTDVFDSTVTVANSQSVFQTLDNGHHFQLNDFISNFPVGHMQPWGQIYVKDAGRPGYSVAAPFCENVTYFFALSVEECYDCFYMNSFVSDATFKSSTSVNPLPCCGNPTVVTGSGKDSYYLTLSFDNTENNPYLNPASSCYVGVDGIYYADVGGLAGDGLIPDQFNNNNSANPTYGYHDPISFRIASAVPYEARFTLNGILTYSWKLALINKTDASPEFIGTAGYNCSGYGFIGLYCSLLTGTGSIKESVVKTSCCDSAAGYTWNNWWYGVGAEYHIYDSTLGYATAYYGDFYGYDTPVNTSTSLTYHENFNTKYPWNARNDIGIYSGWATPAIVAGLSYPGL